MRIPHRYEIVLRGLVAGATCALAVLAGGGLQQSVASVAQPPLVGSAQYVIRADLRLCPSPLCGGYWVALANRSRTRCSDGARRPRCYVARVVDEERHPLETPLAEEALVRADLESWPFAGFGELGVLAIAEVRAPVGKRAPGGFYRVRDLGIRCIRAPCFSLRATRVNGRAQATLSDVDLTGAVRMEKDVARALAEQSSTSGLYMLGRVARTEDGGRVLRASRVYLRAAPPRA